MGLINDSMKGAGTAVGVIGGEAVTTLEFGKSFINRYAVWLLALAFAFVLSKFVRR